MNIYRNVLEVLFIKQFIYLDYDIVNSIIAQSEKGLISQLSQEQESGNSSTTQKEGSASLNVGAGGSVFKLAKAEANLSLQGNISSESNAHTTSKEMIAKTLHDAAFDIAYGYINPTKINPNNQSDNDYGNYIELSRVFDIVDLDYLESLFSKGSLIDFIKKSEKEKIEASASETTSAMKRTQLRTSTSQIKSEIKKAIATSSKQYDDIKEIIEAFRKLIPYNRMLISHDGYLIPMDDQYFRVAPTNLGFKYGGDITCVGMITNIIGEDTNPDDNSNIFATLQFTVNEVLRSILPTNENNLCVIHPIAIYYNN